MSRVVRAAAVWLCLLALGAALGAQERSAAPRRLMLFFSAASEAQFAAVEQRLLYESLLARLATAEVPFRVVEWGGESRPADDAARTEAALGGDCDAWAAVEVNGGMERPGYHVWSFDLVTRKRVVDQSVSRDTPLRPRDLERRFWDEAATLLAAAYQTVHVGTRVSFRGAPSTVITGLPGRPLVLDGQGTAEAVLPNPSLYSIRATHRLYDPVNLTFSVRDEPVKVDLGQKRAPRWIFDGGLETLNFLSADAGIYVLPNYAWIKLGFTTYIAGLAFGGGQDRGVFVSEPLTALWLEAGSYVNRPDASIRYYGGVAGALRLVHSADFFGAEPIAPLGLGLVLGLEGRPWKIADTFLELAPMWYFSRDPDLLAASYPADYSFGGKAVGSGMVDFFQYRVGVRLYR